MSLLYQDARKKLGEVAVVVSADTEDELLRKTKDRLTEAIRRANTRQTANREKLAGSLSSPSFSAYCCSNLELPTGTHHLSAHVAVLRASLENIFTTTIFLPIALL